ncbi:hypothetical protein ES703_05229 [subsurface metagenome]|nr:hypothetical protein [bacterium]
MKLNKRIASILRISACVTGVMCVTGVTGCVSPFYGTAEVSSGLEMSGGCGFVKYRYTTSPEGRIDTLVGGRIDLVARYGFGERLALKGQIGSAAGIGYRGPTSGGREGMDLDHFRVVPAGELGLEYEFVENPSLTISVAGGYPEIASVSLLTGFNLPSAGREIVTLRAQSTLYAPLSVSCTVHPLSKLHLFLGAGINMPWSFCAAYSLSQMYPVEVSAGIGYTLIRK